MPRDMTAADFRSTLARLHLSQSAFARVLQSLGDDRPWQTVLRCVHELARLDRAVPMPWAVVVLLVLMERAPDAWRLPKPDLALLLKVMSWAPDWQPGTPIKVSVPRR